MPPAGEIEKYKALIPDAPERFIRIVESRTVQVSDREDRLADAEIQTSKRGFLVAAWLAFICVGAAIAFIAMGSIIGAGIILSLPAAMLIRSFVGDLAARKRD